MINRSKLFYEYVPLLWSFFLDLFFLGLCSHGHSFPKPKCSCFWYNTHCGALAHMPTLGNRELHLHESHFNKKKLTFITIIYHTKFQFAKISKTMIKIKFFEFLWLLCTKNGKISQGSRHFRKLKLCMVNNSDKSKVFC